MSGQNLKVRLKEHAVQPKHLLSMSVLGGEFVAGSNRDSEGGEVQGSNKLCRGFVCVASTATTKEEGYKGA